MLFAVPMVDEEAVMGNRDARGREKRKPKKKVIKQISRPGKPLAQYKPVIPVQQEQTNTPPVKMP